MTKTMKALVKYADQAGASELRDVPVPQPGPTDVLVEVAYVGVCGTDPHMHHNLVKFDFHFPFIMGHEFAGTIVEVGPQVDGWRNGRAGDGGNPCRILRSNVCFAARAFTNAAATARGSAFTWTAPLPSTCACRRGSCIACRRAWR